MSIYIEGVCEVHTNYHMFIVQELKKVILIMHLIFSFSLEGGIVSGSKVKFRPQGRFQFNITRIVSIKERERVLLLLINIKIIWCLRCTDFCQILQSEP